MKADNFKRGPFFRLVITDPHDHVTELKYRDLPIARAMVDSETKAAKRVDLYQHKGPVSTPAVLGSWVNGEKVLFHYWHHYNNDKSTQYTVRSTAGSIYLNVYEGGIVRVRDSWTHHQEDIKLPALSAALPYRADEDKTTYSSRNGDIPVRLVIEALTHAWRSLLDSYYLASDKARALRIDNLDAKPGGVDLGIGAVETAARNFTAMDATITKLKAFLNQ